MIYGIVGNEAAKFTTLTQAKARQAIRELLQPGDKVVSGQCHLGGIDIWAVEEAKAIGLETEEFPPRIRAWSGYEARNIQIAKAADKVVCITVAELPPDYKGMRFTACYHHKGEVNVPQHIKSGGCWTARYAKYSLGKPIQLIVIHDQA